MWCVCRCCVDYWSESDQEEVDGSMTLKQESTYHCNPAVSCSLSLSLSVLSASVSATPFLFRSIPTDLVSLPRFRFSSRATVTLMLKSSLRVCEKVLMETELFRSLSKMRRH